MRMKSLVPAGVIISMIFFWFSGNAWAVIPDHWITLLKNSVEINSSTDNPEGLDAMRSLLVPELAALGFRTHEVDLGSQHKILLADFPRRKSRASSCRTCRHCLSKASPFQKFQAEEKQLKGPGIIDMKGGLVLMLHVLSELKASNASLKKIRILLNDDEEIGSIFSEPKFKELTHGIKNALVFEPGLPNQALVTSHSGVHWLRLTVKGKAAHAGLEHEKGINACVEMANKIIELVVSPIIQKS